MKVDLSKCKPGDRLKTRLGEIVVVYSDQRNIQAPYFIRVKYACGLVCAVMKDGRYWADKYNADEDIIAILSRCQPKPKPRRSLAEVLFRAFHDERREETLFTDMDENELIDYARAARAVAREVRRRAAK